MTKHEGICALCERENVEITVHHLTPKEEGGRHKPTANLCIPCHQYIHAQYSNKELAVRLNTIASLQDDERIKKFIKWIQKQPSTTLVKTRRANDKPKRRK